jgi:hypothetical protein
VIIARGFALRITTALNDKGVGSNISSNNINNNVGHMRVPTSVSERNLPKDKRERIMGWVERAPLRARFKGINTRERWRVGGTIFRCHCGRGRKEHSD